MKKGALPVRKRRPGGGAGVRLGRRSAGSQRLTGALGETSEGVGVVDGHVGQNLAIELNLGDLQSVHELRVGHAVLARGGVDAGDPQAAEVALAVAAVPIPVLIGLEHRLLGSSVMPTGIAPVA